MARTLLPTLGSYEDGRNPSILVTSQDDFDLRDDWHETHDKGPIFRWRNSCPDKWSTTPTSRWSLRLTSLSSSVVGAGSALTTRAKQLGVGKSTHRAMNQLRKSIGEVTSRTELLLRGSTSAENQPRKKVGGMDDQPENESICYAKETSFTLFVDPDLYTKNRG